MTTKQNAAPAVTPEAVRALQRRGGGVGAPPPPPPNSFCLAFTPAEPECAH